MIFFLPIFTERSPPTAPELRGHRLARGRHAQLRGRGRLRRAAGLADLVADGLQLPVAELRLADDRRPLARPLRLVEALARAQVHRSSRTQGVGHLRRDDAHLLHANRPINRRGTATWAQTSFYADTTFILH